MISYVTSPLQGTQVFDTYWRFAAERQAAFLRRVEGLPWPWTDDPVIRAYRFTNVYRAADRVSQYLIRHVLYEGLQSEEEVFFRALLFKLFNRIQTWELLESAVAPITWAAFDHERYSRVLDASMDSGKSLYSAAYIMPSPSFGDCRKHRNHLHLLEHMMRDGAPRRVAKAASLAEVFGVLRSYPSIGEFLAYQFAIDLNYSDMIDFSESEFVVAGPGARSGIRKCFRNQAGYSDADVIRAVRDAWEGEFSRRGLVFRTLWGRPLQLIDCQNLFCEVDKYARVAHPEFIGTSGRVRIKQQFKANNDPLPQWYPPKWGLNVQV